MIIIGLIELLRVHIPTLASLFFIGTVQRLCHPSSVCNGQYSIIASYQGSGAQQCCTVVLKPTRSMFWRFRGAQTLKIGTAQRFVIGCIRTIQYLFECLGVNATKV